MKKLFLLLFASVLVFSCTKDLELTDSTTNLSATIAQYDDTNMGVYKGLFTTVGTMERGVIEINITPNNYAVASLKLVSGQEISFKADRKIEAGAEVQDLAFSSSSVMASFKLSADLEGNNVQITEVIYKGITSGAIAAHENSRAPVTPITGVLACDDCDAHPLLVTGDTGTFSLLFVGDGSADDDVTALADVGLVVSVTNVGAQSGCVDGGASTTCNIAGGGTIGGNVIGYAGTHTYLNGSDCSEAGGTWSLNSSNHGSYTGTFTSDVTCTPSNNPSVLIVASPGDPTWIDDVELKLEETAEIDADTYLSNGGTPTLAELQAYDAVFLFTDQGAVDPVALGNVLAQYVDGGGHVVDATFTGNVQITGAYTAYSLYSNSGQSNGTNLGIGTIYDPADAILTGVTNFDSGTASYHNTGGTVDPGATVIADYDTGTPLIIKKDNVGTSGTARRVFLNFYPPSSTVNPGFWNVASDGALLMRNALLWAINGGAPPITSVLVVASPGDPTWIDDVELKLEETAEIDADTYLSNGGTPTLAELQAYDAVFLFTDQGAVDPVALGNVLAQYVDGGGHVVDATFTGNVQITGAYTAYSLYSNSGQSNGTNLGIGTIYDPADAILTGVTNFDSGTASYHNTGGTVDPGATVIADYDTGTPLIIKKDNVGTSGTARRVFLNFYPPSSTVNPGFWNVASDGALLMRNALLWANGSL
ncbi:MAG: hypothetical protein ACI9SJ_002445 [Flavobacteriaceae bacterium]|jgi:hypothetical protein